MLAVPFARRSDSSDTLAELDSWDVKATDRCHEGPKSIELVVPAGVMDCHSHKERACSSRTASAPEITAAPPVPRVSATQLGQLSGPRVSHARLKDDFRIDGQVLGTGVSGQVRLGICRRTGRRVAIKSFDRVSMSRGQWEDALSEASAQTYLDHPNIAQLLRVHHCKDSLHIVMECLEGGEVFDRLVQRRRYSEKDAAEVTQQVLLAVSYMHAQGIAHRDLKLENLMYDRKDSNHVKVIDFGFAKTYSDGPLRHECGTLQYMAPEVMSGAYDHKVDMWSIGVIVYMLLVGRHLFDGPKQGVRAKLRDGKPDFAPAFSRLSEGAQSFVKSLLALDPQKRPEASEALKHPWLCDHLSVQSDVNEHAVQRLWAFVDKKKRDKVDLLMRAWSLCNEAQVALRKEFHALDEDSDGFLSPKDLSSVLGSEGDGKAALLFASLDINGDGRVTWSEFVAATMGPPRCKGAVMNDKEGAARARSGLWQRSVAKIAQAAQAAFAGPAWDLVT